jgi:putative transposase
MARQPRLTVAAYPHHIIQRGNNRQLIVLDDADRQFLLALWQAQAQACQVAVHAYVLMGNHFHLLATPETAQGVPRIMQAVGRSYVRYFNNRHGRSGTLWEGRYRSTLIETERYLLACMAYIDLNPVRAGMVAEPAEYRWSGYGEAVGGGAKGNGKKAREGLVRACMSHKGVGFAAEKWQEVARVYRKLLGVALERKAGRAGEMVAAEKKKRLAAVTEKSLQRGAKSDGNGVKQEDDEMVLREMEMAAMLRHRVRYFTAGAVIGSKMFVNEAFAQARERFGGKRKDGARKMRGSAEAVAGSLWSARDLRVEV